MGGAEAVGQAQGQASSLILVGLPGAGKTTVGQGVAEALGWEFVDLDREIERREGDSIATIFASRGEAHFRERERELTAALRGRVNVVLAPGGGWVTIPDGMALLRPPGRIIYLRVRPENALERLGAARADRPLLQRPDPLAELRRLLEERRALYEQADHVVDTDPLTLQQVIQRVAALVRPASAG